LKKIVITGAKGQLSECIEDLINSYNDLEVEFLSIDDLDITDSNSVSKYFNSNKFDFFVNCAAYTDVDKAENEIDLARLINVAGVTNLAISCKDQNAIFIQISTDFVFDGKSSIPYIESDLPNPINVYGKTKKEGEDVLMKTLNQYYILRTSWLYSEYGHNFLKTMLRIAAKKDELGVVFDQIGTPTYAKDLAKVILELINKPKPIEFGIYNYSNEGVASWYDFASAIFEYSKMKTRVNPIRTEKYPTPAKRPYFSVLDKNKIKESLNIKIPHWRDSLRNCLKKYNS
jgi:dTDP-4-dehydrorhamnose reductase